LFTILIDNAVKYTLDKKITIHLYKKNNKAILKTMNKTDEETLSQSTKLFDRFFKVHQSRTSVDSKSYGLGLSIAKFIANNHQGKIETKFEDETIIFKLSLPIT